MTEKICRRIKSSITDMQLDAETWCGKVLPTPRTSGHWRSSNCSVCEMVHNEHLIKSQLEVNERRKAKEKAKK